MKDNTLFFFVFQGKSIFMPLRYLYPECFSLIEKQDQLYPLLCLKSDCPANKGCADILAKRVHYIFNQVVPAGELLIAYYRYRDRPNSIRGGIFTKDMKEPYVSVLNPWAFRKFQKEGVSYAWAASQEYWTLGSRGDILIPEIELIKSSHDEI